MNTVPASDCIPLQLWGFEVKVDQVSTFGYSGVGGISPPT